MLTASFDRAAMRSDRAAWGLFRDRRPELYGALSTIDGVAPSQAKPLNPEGRPEPPFA